MRSNEFFRCLQFFLPKITMIYTGEAVNANDFQSPRYVCMVTVPRNEDLGDPGTPGTGLREMHTCVPFLSPHRKENRTVLIKAWPLLFFLKPAYLSR